MSISAQRIARICELAQLDLDPEASRTLSGDLERIVSLIDELSEVDTTGVEPLAHALDTRARLRDDVVTEDDWRERLQGLAPDVRDGLYIVPRVLE